jgi:hypothetical protein
MPPGLPARAVQIMGMVWAVRRFPSLVKAELSRLRNAWGERIPLLREGGVAAPSRK